MPRRLFVLLLTLLQLIAILPLSASAADAGNENQIRFIALDYPEMVRAGTTMTFRVTADTSREGGATGGTLALKGPGEQYIWVDVKPVATDTLEGSFKISPNSPTGSWSIHSLTLVSNSWAELRLTESETFHHQFTVVSSGQPEDGQGPELLTLILPETAKIGVGFPITLYIRDNLSGVDTVTVVVEPNQGQGLTWKEKVDLRPSGRPDEWIGYILMDPPALNKGSLSLTEVILYDQSGNYTWVKAEELADRQLRTLVRPAAFRVAPELKPSPFLDLIHPGRMTYDKWLEVDKEYLLGLLERLPAESLEVREHLMAEIPQIRAILDEVRTEIYTDPVTGLRVSPFATTGKLLVMDRAISLRTSLLARTHEEADSFTPEVREAHAVYLKWWYSAVADGDTLLPMDGGNGNTYSSMITAYLNFFAQAPEVAAVLAMRADQSAQSAFLTELDPNVIYFTPVRGQAPYFRQVGWSALRIPAMTDEPMSNTVRRLFYQTGLHFGEVFFSTGDDPNRSRLWTPYVALRHGHGWNDGTGRETPARNLAVDFADTYLPFGVGHRTWQSYPELRDYPEMRQAFRELVETLLQVPPPALAFSASGTYQVGVGDSWSLSVKSPQVRGAMVRTAEAFSLASAPSTRREIPATVTAEGITFTSDYLEMGRAFSYMVGAVDVEGRNAYRAMVHLRAPLLLDPIPTGTNKPSVRLSGTTLPGKEVTVGTESTTADDQGRFEIDVPLTPGENLLRLTVAGTDLGVRLVVHAAAESATVPLTLSKEPPALTRDSHAFLQGQTAPYAVLKVGSLEFQAGPDGSFWCSLYLPARINTLQLVSTDRFGNQVTWEQQVIRDIEPPDLTVYVYPRSASTRVYSVSTEPGVTLTLNGEPLRVAKDGTALVNVTLAEGESRELVFVAEDAAGNRTEKRYTFTRQN